MRSRTFLLAVIVLVAGTASAAPCVTKSQACTEWITFGGGPARSLIYRTYSLDAKNDSITGALVMVHGAGRDADNYFRTAVAAAFLAGTLENTIVISPRFASNSGPGPTGGGGGCRDALAPNEVNWPCGGDSWRSGGVSTSHKDLTSFDFADEILRKLARKEVFPNLKSIVVAGHSAGGQFVNRYEMANQVHDKLGVPVTYVVSNPSSYAYLDDTRPSDAAYTVSARAPGYVPAAGEGEGAAAGGGLFRSMRDGRGCTVFDQWPYGLKTRTGYTSKLADDQLKKQLAARPTIYLLGELDILPLGGFDGSCPAMAQGPTRLARGQAFTKYANERFGAHHTMTVVPLCGHNARCMFTAEIALPLIFPQK